MQPGVGGGGPALGESLCRGGLRTALAFVMLVRSAQHRRVIDWPQAPGAIRARLSPTMAARTFHKAPADPLREVRPGALWAGGRP